MVNSFADASPASNAVASPRALPDTFPVVAGWQVGASAKPVTRERR